MATNKLSKKELLTNVSEKTGVSKAEAEKVLDSYHELLVDLMKDEVKFTFPNFGTYQLRTSKARVGRNPATGEQIQIPEKKKIKFSPSKPLKEALLG